MCYSTKNIILNIFLEPKYLDENLEEYITKKSTNILLNKEINNFGIITSVVKLNNLDGGIIISNGSIKFRVKMDVKVYLPELNSIIKSKVKELTLHGYYIDEPLQIFVNKENSKLSIGDDVTVQVNKIGFNKGNFIIIANEKDTEKIVRRKVSK